MLIYAIARRLRDGRLEYYVPLDRGNVIGWTADLSLAWVIENVLWAEEVRRVLILRGQGVDTFVHPHRP